MKQIHIELIIYYIYKFNFSPPSQNKPALYHLKLPVFHQVSSGPSSPRKGCEGAKKRRPALPQAGKRGERWWQLSWTWWVGLVPSLKLTVRP